MRTQYAPTVRPHQVAIRNKFAAPTSKRRERKHVDLNWPVSVADGRTAVGVIDKIGAVFIAIDTRGVSLGEFSTLSEAVRIFPESATDHQTSPAANFIKPRPARRASPPATSPIPKTRHGQLASVMNIHPAQEILP
jgi:hypothetical protein